MTREIAAVVLSKLDVTKAATLLSEMPGPRARKISFAISQTAGVTPQAVDRIAAILTAASDDLRDEVINGLRETDMIIALCHANGNGMEEVSEFIPSGLSRRMAKTTREEIEERGAVKTKEGEPAVTALVSGTQGQISAGEISFVDLDDN